jgi:tetratricopeptide (TPR) repeat protein
VVFRFPSLVSLLAGGWLIFAVGLAGYGSLSPTVGVWGWPRLAAIFALCGLPLAAACVSQCIAVSPGGKRGRTLELSGAAILGGALVGAWGAGLLGETARFGFWAAHLGRVALAVTLAAASVAAGALLLRTRRGESESGGTKEIPQPYRPTAGAWLLTTAMAVGLPLLFTLDLARKQTTAAEEAILAGRFVEAEDRLRRLGALGSPFAVGGLPLDLAAHATSERRRELEARAAAGVPRGASDRMRLALAEDLLALDRLPEALSAVLPAAARSVPAALLAGHVLQRQGAWSESSRHYRHALDQLRDAPPAQQSLAARALAAQVRAYDALAFNLREQGRYDEAAALYQQAVKALPAAAAHFHFQLGLHLQRYADRPAAAQLQFARAVELEPALSGQIAQAVAAELWLPAGRCGWGRAATDQGY